MKQFGGHFKKKGRKRTDETLFTFRNPDGIPQIEQYDFDGFTYFFRRVFKRITFKVRVLAFNVLTFYLSGRPKINVL